MTRLWTVFSAVGRWAFGLFVLAAGLTRHGGDVWHFVFGYAVLIVLVLRVAQGFVGQRHSRFSEVLGNPKGLGREYRQLLSHQFSSETMRVLRGYCLVAALAAALLTAVTGILLTTDFLWFAKSVSVLHGFFATTLLFVMLCYLALRYLSRHMGS